MACRPFGSAAEEGVLQPRVTVSGDDNQVRLQLARGFSNLVIGHPNAHHLLLGQSWRQKLICQFVQMRAAVRWLSVASGPV